MAITDFIVGLFVGGIAYSTYPPFRSVADTFQDIIEDGFAWIGGILN